MSDLDYDVVVVGAGFGGLATALELTRRGARVALCESLSYPGGCASTFRRGGFAFESGATLFSGFEPHQLFGRWIREHALNVTVDWLDPVVELRTPGLRLPVTRDRARFIESLCALPEAPAPAIRRLFELQSQVAGALWAMFDDPDLLPPFDLRALFRHAARLHRYAPLARWLGRPLGAVLEHLGLSRFTPLRTYLDALCQITVQCSAAEAETPFALAAMDYYWRGTGHVRGGIGQLAWALARAMEARGGTLMLANRVKGLSRQEGHWQVDTRRGVLRARHVVANLLPGGLMRLAGLSPERVGSMRALSERVAEGWGAAMLYLVIKTPDAVTREASHLELVRDEQAPFIEGNHIFMSISGEEDTGRAPEGHRTVTTSTHVPLRKLGAMPADEQARYISDIQTRMRESLEQLAPEWMPHVTQVLPASPRTFQRFTQRESGAVGGVPRRAGLSHYRHLGPLRVMEGLWLVGDSAFPGQSTLATAVGGVRTAASVARES
ncbi:FAD-dependent oxidoreductase [Myxococcus fulvus 124B02]|nr:FAD-dependent oxidoreductase [Myxococcus fulvus 124B02]